MKSRMLAVLTGCACVAMAAGPARGAALAAGQLPAGTRWILHIDLEAVNASQVGKQLLDEIAADPKSAARLDVVRNTFGIDPRKDLQSVTFYGADADRNKAVALLKGAFQVDPIMALLNANEAHEAIPYSGVVVHKWQLKQDRLAYCCFFNPNLLIVGRDLERVKEAIGVAGGAVAPLAPDNRLVPAGATAAGVLIAGAARGLNADPALRPSAVILRNAEYASLLVGENAGQVSAELKLDAPSAPQAEMIGAVLRGMMAFGELAGSQDSPCLLKNLQVQIQDKQVVASFSGPAAEVLAAIKAKRDMLKKKQEPVPPAGQ